MKLLSQTRLASMERVRNRHSPYAASADELAARQVRLNSRKEISGGVAYARKKIDDAKMAARHEILNLLTRREFPKGLSILTMPGMHWEFEKKLLSVREGNNWKQRTQPARNTNITAVEIDPAVYAAGSYYIPRTTDTTIVTHIKSPQWCAHSIGSNAIRRFYNADVFNLMEHNEPSFDVVWLDFTGPYCWQGIERIREFYLNRVARILIVTFMVARQNGEAQLAEARAGGPEAYLADRFPGRVLHAIRYQDASPMLQFAVSKE